MDRRLIPINAWIALHRGEARWPSALRDQGYRIHRIEAPVGTSVGIAVVDGMSVNDVAEVVVATECKSGANVPLDQARNYGAMTCTDVRRAVGLPFHCDTAVLQPMYACLAESRDRVRLGLEKASLDVPLLVIGETRVRLEAEGHHKVAPFNEPLTAPPPRYITVDAQSTDEEFLEILLPELMAAAARGDEFVSMDTLMRAALPYWEVFGADARKQLRRRWRDALARAIAKDFPSDFRFEASGPKLDREILRILVRPGAIDPRGQTQSWQRLRRQAALALGRPARRQPAPGQQTLFEELGLDTELGEP